ncbi:MAG: amidohydrolase family protein [Planctomycetes bacterium]|nr:amidohydrolase family protein [Planctomycetota bacterium]
MIIDLHTQVWANLEQLGCDLAAQIRARPVLAGADPLEGTPIAHERAMACVDGAVVLGFRSERLGARIPDEFVAEFVAKDPRRRVGVAGVDPLSGDALDQIDAAVGLGLVGVAVSPACQGFHPAHSEAMRVYERCAELSLPVFVTMQSPLTPAAELEFARPGAWDEVARALPTLPIIISQLGHPWIDEALLLLGKHERVFADISGIASRPWQLYNALLSASSLGVMDRLLFGSGFPLETPARAIESLYTVNAFSHGTQLPSIARASIRSIVERDSLACLGIDSEISAPPPRTEDDEPQTIDELSPAGGSAESINDL